MISALQQRFVQFASSNGLLAIGGLAGGLLAIVAVVAPRAAAWGWLVGFLVFSSAPIGAIALGLIRLTTGGRWGEALAPTLRLGGLAALLSPVYFALLLVGLRLIYPWADRGAAIAPDVARLYLNDGGFAARGLASLIGWAAIGMMLASGRLGLLGAAIALVFHGVAVSLVAVDWGVSLAPGFSDSAFGAEFAVQQIVLALALAAALQPRRAIALAGGDLGGLLLAASLGAAYLAAMTFIVKWYGDQPIDAAWYLARAHGRERAFLVGWIAFGALVPIVACSWERVRASPGAMRSVAAAVAAGISLHDLWLAGPAAPILAAPAAALALVAMAAPSAWVASALGRRLPSAAQAREFAP